MENPIAVANYFIKKSQDAGSNLTPMQLVKLVYIAHGWHLALSGEPLLSERVEAWKYGPVVPDVYHQFKKYGNGPIQSLACTINFSKGGVVYPVVETEESKKLLDKVWELYHDFSGVQLSTMTHMEGTPWYKTWHEDGGKNMQGAAIPNDLIKKHYLQKVETGTNGSAH